MNATETIEATVKTNKPETRSLTSILSDLILVVCIVSLLVIGGMELNTREDRINSQSREIATLRAEVMAARQEATSLTVKGRAQGVLQTVKGWFQRG